jgi:class 3 adenylate cyclase/tetratricopeptide (TPR) repeat protein
VPDNARKGTRERAESAPHRAPSSSPRTVSQAAIAYVPRILLESLAAHPSRPAPWYEWVDGTLVMADVSGFTAMSERLAQAGKEGAEWLTDVINWYFGQMLDIASGCGGTTLTFGGDAILLLFYGEDHERRGIAASLRMLNATRHLPAYRVANHRIRLSMSMGAHAGRFLTASVGTRDSAQFLVLGPETVRTAHAEAQASSGELAITPAMAERVAGSTLLEPTGDFHRVVRLVDTPRFGPEVARSPTSVPADVLAAYLPHLVSDALLRAPDAPLPEQDHEHRSVTVAFINVLGVDRILEREGPEVLLARLQEYTEPIVRLLDEHEGYMVSNDIYTDGFKLIAAFGAPVAHEHDAANALRFASALRDELEGTATGLTHRVGVNGGFVFAGDVGPLYRRQYTVMGDAVNLSARLMTAAETGSVLVSARTVERAGEGFRVRALPPIRVKGKSQPVEISLLEGVCDPSARTGSPAIEGDHFFGREAEMAVLATSLASAAGGSGRLVVVRGEAGMGKSRLTSESERLAASVGWTVLIGRAQRHTTGQPFAPWVPILEAIIGLRPDDDVASRSAKTLAAVGALGPGAADWAPLLDQLLGTAIPENGFVRSLNPGGRRERMFELVLGLLQCSSRTSPLLVHLEDLHWADDSSLELLAHVARGIRDDRVLLIATERMEGAADLDVDAGTTTTIDLIELPREAATGLLRQALGEDLPADAVDALLAKTRGNPLFLQEVARSIGRTRGSGRSRSVEDLAEAVGRLDVPDRIQGLLMSSIDSLPAPAKEILRMASVVGASFDDSVLRGVLAQRAEERSLDEMLRSLAGMSLVEPDPTSHTRAYRFRHALIQEVAYDSLTFAKRRRLHLDIARYLENANTADLEPVYESLSHHYSAGHDDHKTLEYSLLAAAKARRLFAQREAIGFYRRAMRAVRARTPQAAVTRSLLDERIGDTLETAGRSVDAAREFRRSLERWLGAAARIQSTRAALPEMAEAAHDLDAEAREAALCHKIGASFGRSYSHFDLALEWLDRAWARLPRGRPALRARISVALSYAWYHKGEYRLAIEWGRRGLETARRTGSRDVCAYALTILANSYCELGDLRLAIQRDSRALALYEELGDVSGMALAQLNLGSSFADLGRVDEALEHYRLAHEMYVRIGNTKQAAIVEQNIGWLHVRCGDFDLAVDRLTHVLETCARMPAALYLQGGTEHSLACALQGLRKYDEARAALDRAERLLDKAGTPMQLVEVHLQRADLELEMGDTAEARRTCERARTSARRLGHRQFEIQADRTLGRIAHACGDTGLAETLLRSSIDHAIRIDAPYERGLGLLALARLYADPGAPKSSSARSRRIAGTAARALDAVGARGHAAEARGLASPGHRATSGKT